MKIVFRLLSLNNKVGNFAVPSLLIADFFEKIDKLFFLSLLKSACYQGFAPSLIPNGVGVMYSPFYEKNFSSKNQKQPKSLCLRAFSAEKYFEKILKFIEKRAKICYNDKKVNL